MFIFSEHTVYLSPEKRQHLQRGAKLLPNADRLQVYLLDEFGASKTKRAHPLLVRAELLALGNDRLREVADKPLKDELPDKKAIAELLETTSRLRIPTLAIGASARQLMLDEPHNLPTRLTT
jgi:hypothetical protein